VPHAELPFDANLPVAHSLMSHDVHFGSAPVLDALQAGAPVPEEKPAGTEMVILQDRIKDADCVVCHVGKTLCGQSFEATGLYGD
jgi:hypothetical protein